MASFYRGNFRGIGNVMRQPGIRRALLSKAHEAKAIAESVSPVGTPPDDEHPGLYRRSFRVEYGEKPVKFHGVKRPRPYARLVNTTSYAMDVEFGNHRYAGHAPLRKTLDLMKAAHSA